MATINSSSRLDQILDKNEQVLWRGKPEFIPFVCSGLIFVVLGMIWATLDYLAMIRNTDFSKEPPMFPFFIFIHLTPFWASFLNMWRLVIVHKNLDYAITDKRLIKSGGIMGLDIRSIEYDKIEATTVDVNPLENFFDVGSINVPGFGKFMSIAVPYQVYKKIKEVTVNIKTDWNYPNAFRPDENPGYKTKYTPEK